MAPGHNPRALKLITSPRIFLCTVQIAEFFGCVILLAVSFFSFLACEFVMTNTLYQLTARGEDSGIKAFVRSFLEEYRAEIVSQEYRARAF